MSRAYDTIGPGGVATLTPTISNYVNNYLMVANTARTVTWPAGMSFCNITGTDPWAVAAGTAAVPGADVLDGTGSGISVAQRQRAPGETKFSIISATAQTLAIEFWQTSHTD